MVYSLVLGVAGFSILWFWVNEYAFLFAVIGFVVYVGFYSLWTKRTTIHQTIVGSISGAAPPVIGYTAVANQFDMGAYLFFLGMHFGKCLTPWGIAVYRFEDYKNAGIPILPVARSIHRTKIEFAHLRCIVLYHHEWIICLWLYQLDLCGRTEPFVSVLGVFEIQGFKS